MFSWSTDHKEEMRLDEEDKVFTLKIFKGIDRDLLYTHVKGTFSCLLLLQSSPITERFWSNHQRNSSALTLMERTNIPIDNTYRSYIVSFKHSQLFIVYVNLDYNCCQSLYELLKKKKNINTTCWFFLFFIF